MANPHNKIGHRLDWTKLLNTERRKPSARIKGDPRSEFERDYDRSLFATPVRRMQDKAQVFPLEPHDSIRTRLTHSLEVSAIARTLGFYCARIVQQRERKRIKRDITRDIEFLCLTCGLLHDIGNPPFGHSGEKAISDWFGKRLDNDETLKSSLLAAGETEMTSQRFCDLTAFEGNAQTFRIITKLQLLDNYYGLNLTYGTLAASLKYVAKSHQMNNSLPHTKKPGYFYSENDVVEEVRRKTGLGSRRHPVAYLVEAADDTAYSVIDIEDALKKGIISWEQLRAFPEAAPLKSYIKQAEARVKKSGAARELTPKEKNDARAVHLRTILITQMVKSVVRSFGKEYEKIMRGTIKKPLEKLCDMGAVFAACKTVGKKRIYYAKDVLKLEVMGRQVITDLMNVFWVGAHDRTFDGNAFLYPNKVWELMSPNYRRVFEHYTKQSRKKGLTDYYQVCQLVSDYICGMTDTFACSLHRELFNAK
ncbi:MAG TPA: dNTP triphosphohydrolase [Lacunisphaera sp.]|nr:dNTP triphosphohydrolase [Lacunisphaera sp.]